MFNVADRQGPGSRKNLDKCLVVAVLFPLSGCVWAGPGLVIRMVTPDICAPAAYLAKSIEELTHGQLVVRMTPGLRVSRPGRALMRWTRRRI